MFLYIAFIAHSAALGATFSSRQPRGVLFLTIIGLLCSTTVFTNSYFDALPMLPMHLGLMGLIVGLTLIWCCRFVLLNSQGNRQEGLLFQSILVVLLLLTIFFPKDFYLPFIRSLSPWAHLFLLLGILARALLLYGAIIPLMFLLTKGGNETSQGQHLATSMRFITWGYGFLALSMFSGEVWSYLGWGTPVVWQDAAITTTIGLWLYWTCFLHLHYIRSWTLRRRIQFMFVGALLVVIFTSHPDLGPFRALSFFS